MLESGNQCLSMGGGSAEGGPDQGEVGEAWPAPQEDVRGSKQG